MAENPFANAMQQLKKAATVAKLNPLFIASLQKPQRIMEANLSITMDSGAVQTFTAFRVQYNDARGRSKAAFVTTPKSI